MLQLFTHPDKIQNNDKSPLLSCIDMLSVCNYFTHPHAHNDKNKIPFSLSCIDIRCWNAHSKTKITTKKMFEQSSKANGKNSLKTIIGLSFQMIFFSFALLVCSKQLYFNDKPSKWAYFVRKNFFGTSTAVATSLLSILQTIDVAAAERRTYFLKLRNNCKYWK